MSKVIKLAVESVVALVDALPTVGDIVSRIVELTWDDIRAIGVACGYDEHEDTLRDNRNRQVTTGKLLDLLREPGKPRWSPTVANIYIRTDSSKLPAVVNGGNTFRASYDYLKDNQKDTVSLTISYSNMVDFGAFDQIDATRTGKSNLETRFGDGYSEYYNELFGLSCLRTLAKPIDGGGDSKRTWKGVVYYPDQLANGKSSIFDQPWFDCLYNFGVAEGEDKQSLMAIAETISETLQKGKFKQIHHAYLVCGVVDCLGSILDWETDDKGNIVANAKLSQAISRIRDSLGQACKLLIPTFAPSTKGVTIKPSPKYSALCHWLHSAIDGKALPKVLNPEFVVPQGMHKALVEFDQALIDDKDLREYYSIK